MKKIAASICTLLLAFSISAQVKAPQPSPKSTLEQKVGLTDVKLEYSRPGVKGRTIFGDLVPFGKLWRTGANKNSIITLSTKATINGKNLAAGSYAIFTIPNKDTWEVIFYKNTENWGAPKKLDKNEIALRTTIKTHPIPFSVESFTMDINGINNNGARLEFIWEQTYAAVDFNVPTDALVMKSISKTMDAKPNKNDYYAAAVYYLENDKNIKLAKKWIDKAVKANKKKPLFYMLRRQALIYAKADKKKAAIKIMETSLELAKKAGNADYIKMNKASLIEWATN
jgi:hypothetical protein